MIKQNTRQIVVTIMMLILLDSASYMKNGQTVHVPGADLLRSAIPCERFPMMRIEVSHTA